VRFEDLAGRDVVIWGAGREGRAAYAELGRRGIPATFVVTGDGAVPADLAPIASVGPRAVERLERADVVIKSPGVPRTAPELAGVRERGVAVTSLTDLWLSDNAARVVAVTGTKGKSTTSALIRHLLTSTGIPAALVGNGGTPVTDGDTADARVAVAEVSSYQAADLSVSPRVAVVTSLFPEHLPWHGGFEQYVRDKLNLVAHGCEVVVVPDLDGDLAARVRTSAGPHTRLVEPGSVGLTVSEAGIDWGAAGRIDARDLRVQGRHNLTNVALALAAVTVGFDVEEAVRAALLDAARTFRPLEHRLEPVPSGDGRLWVDDSLATAPEAVVAALETYPSSRVALILGGADRGLSFAPLRDYLAARPADAPVSVVAVGPAGARWVAEAGDATGGAHRAAGFTEALAWIGDDLDGCEVVLLSPGAPSFDEFASYEERSAAFRQAARLARSAQ